MQIFSSGKFALSTDAMKRAAHALGQGGEEAVSARRAVMAALRHDNPYPLKLQGRKPPRQRYTPGREWQRDVIDPEISYELAAPLTWVFGGEGSGKSEMAHAFMRGAARAGRSCLQLSCWEGHAAGWLESERVTALCGDPGNARRGLPAMADVVRALSQQAAEARTYCGVLLRPLYVLEDEQRRQSVALLDRLPNVLCKGMVLALEEPFLPYDPGSAWFSDLAGRLRTAATRVGAQVIIFCRDHLREDPEIEVAPEDGLLLGKSCHTSSGRNRFGAPDLEMAIEGEFVLRDAAACAVHNGRAPAAAVSEGFAPVLGGFESSPEPISVYTEAAQRVMRKIEDGLGAHHAQTHIQRLEMVARSCGYRSWHAAQGRRAA